MSMLEDVNALNLLNSYLHKEAEIRAARDEDYEFHGDGYAAAVEQDLKQAFTEDDLKEIGYIFADLPRRNFGDQDLRVLLDAYLDPSPSAIQIEGGHIVPCLSIGNVPEDSRHLSFDLKAMKSGGWTFADIVRYASGLVLLEKYGADKLRRKLRDNLNKLPVHQLPAVCDALGLFE